MPRNEAQWLAASEPLAMVEVLRARGSERQVRLFASGCCRLAMSDPLPERSRLAVEVAERYADGDAGRDELLRARSIAFYEADQFSIRESKRLGNFRTMTDEEMRMYFLAESVHPYTPFRIGLLRHRLRWDRSLLGIAPVVLRDVLGNPFRRSLFDLRWRTHEVTRLAHAIYDDHSFNRLPDLAVALEGSGCDDGAILRHCRQHAGHVRGCWVVDAILGRS